MTNSGFKLTLGAIIGIVMIVFLINSCERIDAGHVGVKVNLYGTGKGVDDITECTGIVFYNPISTKIYEFPTYMQHKEYVKKEDSDNSFVINSKDGSEFHVSPIINYSVQRDKVPFIFNKYRRTLESIEEGFLKTTIYDAFRMTANIYTAEELISNRQVFETSVRAKLDADLLKEGFIISQLTSNLGYPESFKNAINAKNNAVQQALTAENQVKTAEANAKIQVAKATGNAEAMLTKSRAEAESYRLKQSAITPMLLQQMWVEKWNGVLPTTQLGASTNMMYNVK
jgi:regulator of protease activity HflC (stomatin/prohibitin superfamily)